MDVEDDQFGFRSGKGTREELLALRILLERRFDLNRSTHVTFVDIEKTCDNVDGKRLMEIGEDRRIIFQLYKHQKARIDIKGVRKFTSIRKGAK